MERKNLFLAVLLLASANCPTITNTTDAGAAVVTEGAKEVASWSLLNPQGWSWKTIGVLGAAMVTGQIMHRVIQNGFHSENQIGTVDIANTQDIKKVMIKLKIGSRSAYVKLNGWNKEQEQQAKNTFTQVMERNLKIKDLPEAKFTYEVSLILQDDTSVLLTKPLNMSDTITLDKRNTQHKNFIEVLWNNVIKHSFVLAQDCKTDGNERKSATQLPNASQFDITYQAEITQMDYTLSPHTLVKAAPLALVARHTGFPTSCSALGAYTGAYVATRLMSKKLGSATRGLNLELPKKKTTLTADTEEALTAEVNRFKLKHSTKIESQNLQEWTHEKERLVEACKTAPSTTAKENAVRALTNHAQLEKTFAITQVAVLTDKVSGLTLKYTTPKEIFKTGALRRKKVVKLSDLNINLTDGSSYWNNAKAACDTALTGVWNGICFLNPFNEDEELEVDNDELEL